MKHYLWFSVEVSVAIFGAFSVRGSAATPLFNHSEISSGSIQIADRFSAANDPSNSNCLSGNIITNTTWYATNSPYVVCGSLTVNTGVTLTIEPGTAVYLDSGVNLTVSSGGRIVAEGNETKRITFTRLPDSNTRWGGITIEGEIGSTETSITYAHIEFNGITAIHSSGGTVFLDHLTFGTTDYQYVSLDNSSFLISNCYFPTSTAPFELLHGTGGIKSGGRGIVRDCFFGTTSAYNDIMDFTGGNRPDQPIIQYYNNVFSGATDDILDLDGTDAWIEGNIFLHSHRNGAPDTSSAISGGDSGGITSEITIIGNLFFDCDEAATAKQGNFFTLINNTMVHITKTGGTDTASGVVNVRDVDPGPPTTFGAGFYLEGNIITDAEQLVRNYDAGQTTVTFNNNILPFPWDGPGSSNTVVDPMLKHIPQISETVFTNWAQAQVLRDWFSLLPGSPAVGTGPNGLDKGGIILSGASISGEPNGTTSQTTATLTVGVNRAGSGIPIAGWPDGSGYTGYKWRLDSGPWSAEMPIATAIFLTNLIAGPHYVEVIGKRDSGWYQDDPAFGPDATVTHSRTWTVQPPLTITSASETGGEFTLHFTAEAGKTYTVQYKDSLTVSNWSKLSDVPEQSSTGDYAVVDSHAGLQTRFYRLVTPAQP